MVRTLRDNQASWDALFYAIITGCTAKDALLAMGICPDSENNLARRTEREAKKQMKGYEVPDGYMGWINGKYQLFESESEYYETLLEREEV